MPNPPQLSYSTPAVWPPARRDAVAEFRRGWLGKTAACVLLYLGVVMWMGPLGMDWDHQYQFHVLFFVFLGCLVWPVYRYIALGLDKCSSMLAPHRLKTASVLALITAAYLSWHCFQNYSLLHPGIHDEHVYTIQTRMLLRGRLWMPSYPPEIQPFFDTDYMLQGPTYAPMYFPGTALMAAPFFLVHLPYWTAMVILASLSVSLLYLVIEEIFGPIRAIVAALMLMALPDFQNNSQLFLSELPLLFLALLMVYAWLRWRKDPLWGWELLIGIAAGWAEITRPLEAVCYAVPIGLAMIARRWSQGWNPILKTLAVLIAGGLPFLVLQGVQNKGVTGHWLRYPTNEYANQNWPAHPFGFHKSLPPPPSSISASKQKLNQIWVMIKFRRHTLDKTGMEFLEDRLPFTVRYGLPNPMMAIVFPLALLALWDVRRFVLTIPLLLFLGLYFFYIFYLRWYMVGIAPCLIVLALLGAEGFEAAWPRLVEARTFFTLAALALCIGSLPEVDRISRKFHEPFNHSVDVVLNRLPRQPALVLFRFNSDDDPHDEPVYNDAAAFPDDALIVRAHDLGDQENKKLFQYYAQRQPDRMVYLFDRHVAVLTNDPLIGPLGTVRDLAR